MDEFYKIYFKLNLFKQSQAMAILIGNLLANITPEKSDFAISESIVQIKRDLMKYEEVQDISSEQEKTQEEIYV